MVTTPLQLAKRAFVKVLLALAAQYSVSLQLTRDSPDAHLLPAFRRVVKKVHPDKGGREEGCFWFLLVCGGWAVQKGSTLFPVAGSTWGIWDTRSRVEAQI